MDVRTLDEGRTENGGGQMLDKRMPEIRGRAITSTSECRGREGERSLQQANAGDERVVDRTEDRTEDRGMGEDEDLDSWDNYTRGCMREKEEPTTC
jgi:hypothetical protein